MNENISEASHAHDLSLRLARPWNQQLPRIAVNALTDPCFISGWVPINRILSETLKTPAHAEMGVVVSIMSVFALATYLFLRTGNEVLKIGEENNMTAFMKGEEVSQPIVIKIEDKNFWKRMGRRARANSPFLIQPVFQLASALLTVPVALRSVGQGGAGAELQRTAFMFVVNAVGNVLYALQGDAPMKIGSEQTRSGLLHRVAKHAKPGLNFLKYFAGNPVLWGTASFVDIGETLNNHPLSVIANGAFGTGIALTFMTSFHKISRDFQMASHEVTKQPHHRWFTTIINKPQAVAWCALTTGCALAGLEQMTQGHYVGAEDMALFTAMGVSIFAKEVRGGVWECLNPHNGPLARAVPRSEKAGQPKTPKVFGSSVDEPSFN